MVRLARRSPGEAQESTSHSACQCSAPRDAFAGRGRRWAGAMEHCHVPGGTKKDAAGLIDALAGAGCTLNCRRRRRRSSRPQRARRLAALEHSSGERRRRDGRRLSVAGSFYVSLPPTRPMADRRRPRDSYGSYARQAVARSTSGWTVRPAVDNDALISFRRDERIADAHALGPRHGLERCRQPHPRAWLRAAPRSPVHRDDGRRSRPHSPTRRSRLLPGGVDLVADRHHRGDRLLRNRLGQRHHDLDAGRRHSTSRRRRGLIEAADRGEP